MPTEKPKVFFCYTRADSQFAFRLANGLRSVGVNIWIDQLDIPPGEDWDIATEKALEACDCLLAIFSPNSIQSREVRNELNYALEEEKRIVPVLYKEVKIPYRLRLSQRIDFTGEYEKGFKTLLGSFNIETPAATPAEKKETLAKIEQEGPKLDSLEIPEPTPPPKEEKDNKKEAKSRAGTASRGWLKPLTLISVSVFILLLTGVLFLTNSGFRQQFGSIFSDSSAMVSTSIPALDQTHKVLLIPDFEDRSLESNRKNYSVGISKQIMALLVNSGFVKIVESNKWKAFLEGQKTSDKDIDDPEIAMKVHIETGVQKVLLGEYQRSERGKYSISSRLVDTESGIIEGQWIISDIEEGEIKKYSTDVATEIINKLKTQLALEKIAHLENANAPFNVSISAQKNTFYFGDRLNLTVEVDTDCYVLLFDFGTSGKIHLLFPNRMQPNNFIKAGQKTHIENIRVSPPAGTETVKAIATLDSVSFGKMLEFASLQTTFLPFGENAAEFAKDLEVVVSPLANDRWTAATLTLEIREK